MHLKGKNTWCKQIWFYSGVRCTTIGITIIDGIKTQWTNNAIVTLTRSHYSSCILKILQLSATVGSTWLNTHLERNTASYWYRYYKYIFIYLCGGARAFAHVFIAELRLLRCIIFLQAILARLRRLSLSFFIHRFWTY